MFIFTYQIIDQAKVDSDTEHPERGSRRRCAPSHVGANSRRIPFALAAPVRYWSVTCSSHAPVPRAKFELSPSGGTRRRLLSHPLPPPHSFCRCRSDAMGKKERAKRFAEVKRMLNPKDAKVDKKKHQKRKSATMSLS